MFPLHNRAGFTVLEVVVALAVSSVVVLAAHQLFVVVADTGSALIAQARAQDEAQNRLRLVRQLTKNADVYLDARFSGDSLSAQFKSWCPTPGGWRESCRVDLQLVPSGDSVALEARWLDRHQIILTGSPPARISYLQAADKGGDWQDRWGVGALSAPLALRIVVGADTLFLRIGERG